MNVPLEEYFRTAFEDRLLVKMPEREDDHLTPATRLLEKRRETQEVDQALTAQKEEFHMKMESLNQRKEELERKEYELKESVLKLDRFLKENDAKKGRAQKKAKDEIDITRQKKRELDLLNEDNALFLKVRDALHAKMDKYVVYHKYLEKVIEVSEEFTEIREIVDRYETLSTTYQKLIERDHGNQEQIEDERQSIAKFREVKNNELLNYNNELGALQTRLDVVRSEALKWDNEWNRIKQTAADKTLELGKAKMSTYNLYHVVSAKQKHLAEVPGEETHEQLNRIKLFIQDYVSITNEVARKLQTKNAKFLSDVSST